ncbi:MAG: DNA ligase [Deltaproteobacteria bacterium]|nr:DNA ligase [Deltaproteobacteria bacterium]
MPDLEDGGAAEVPGSGGRTYTLKNIGGAYSCTCPAWQFQNQGIERRSCKHLRAYRGVEAEEARIGAPSTGPARRPTSGGGALSAPSSGGATSTVAPKVLLAQRWDSSTRIEGWWISEKLDGVRAYWDGQQFLSRQGNVYWAPTWFVADLPEEPLDGELWVGRKRFQQTVSIVRRQDESDHWKEVRYLVFDAPDHDGGFEERLEHVKSIFAGSQPEYAHVVAHERCRDATHLQEELSRVEALGGEGLMLRQPASRYVAGRSATLLKVKSFHDAEGRVKEHLPGMGKHEGRLGALRMEAKDGTLFSVGTGFSDAEREDPPAIGALVTFRFQELTDAGVPRFPSYVGVRHDLSWEQVVWPPESIPVLGKGATGSAAGSEPALAPVADLSAVPPATPPKPVEEVSRQLQFEGSKSVRFWEVEQHGAKLTITSGRVGREPRVETISFRTAKLAAERADVLTEAKIEKGYEEF